VQQGSNKENKMIIETQPTPDDNVLNFFPPVAVLKGGSAEFVDAKSLRRSPLAEQIFDIGDIVSVFMTPDMVSVTKTAAADWDDLKPQIMAEIMDYLATGENPVVDVEAATGADEVIKQVQGLINARIRPAVKQDGGDIVYHSFDDGIVYVEMRGACAGCPYAMVTLKDGVERLLKTYIPAVKEVRNITAKKEERV